MLAAKKDDVVIVLTKHYSGWNYCRHLTTGQEGWVPDTFMKLHGSRDSAKALPYIQTVKKYRTITETLQRIVEM